MPNRWAAELQPDGKILIGASGGPAANQYRFVVFRLLATGELDTTFDGDGIVVTDLSTGTEQIRDLEVLPDGKILAVGGGSGTTSLVRPASPGAPVPSYAVVA